MNNEALFSSVKTEWGTPPDFFKPIDDFFNFDLDVCADKKNTVCEEFFNIEQDGLKKPWSKMNWCNPPYGRNLILPWVEKSAEEPGKTVMLVPSRTDSRWYQYALTKVSYVVFIEGRIKFVCATSGAPFPSSLLVFNSKLTPAAKVFFSSIGKTMEPSL